MFCTLKYQAYKICSKWYENVEVKKIRSLLKVSEANKNKSQIFFLFLNENMLWPLIRTVSMGQF